MLALCSMLSRTYYAHFNAGIIRAPLLEYESRDFHMRGAETIMAS